MVVKKLELCTKHVFGLWPHTQQHPPISSFGLDNQVDADFAGQLHKL